MHQAQAVLSIVFVLISATISNAACVTSGPPSISISPVLINLGTNLAPGSVSVTITATYPKTGTGQCSTTDLVTFTSPFTLTRVGGLETINYSISPNGGTPIIESAITSNVKTSFNATLTVVVSLTAGQTGTSGSYVGSVTAQMKTTGGSINGSAGVAVAQATVNNPTTCTIGGAANGGTKTLDFSNGKTVSTTQQFAIFGSVTCNNSAVMTLTSQNGAVTNAAATDSTHQNFFDYIATTTVNGGTVTLNTSTVPGTGAAETSTGNITSTSTTNAVLSVGVTPIAPTQPLVAGSYNDVLTLTITPN